MSAGAFQKSRYETNGANVVNISIQPETLTFTAGGVANDPPAGQVSAGFPSAKVSGGRASIGINARLVRFKFTDTVPTGYKPDSVLSIPVLTQAAFNAYTNGATGTYNPTGTPANIIVIGVTPEKIR